jgi:hypothetical protein
MPKITYIDKDKAAQRVTFYGRDFEHKEPVEVDAMKEATLIRYAAANSWFQLSELGDSDPPKAYQRGTDAAAGRKERKVPNDIKGKPDETHWLAGFDDKAKELDEAEASRRAAVLADKGA